MKKLTIALATGLMSMSGWSACTYDFNATQAQISTVFSGFQKFPNIVGQIASTTIAATQLNSPLMYVAANGNAITGQSNGSAVPQNGVFAYEYKFKLPATLLQNKEQMILYPNYADAYYGSKKGQIIVMYANHLEGSVNPNNVSFVIGSTLDGATGLIEVPVSGTSDGYQKIGIYVNQDTKQVGVIYNGVNKGYISTNPDKINSLSFTSGLTYYGIDSLSPNIGKVHSIELITDKNQFQFTYPSGTKDICGNTI
jgi:hypothetical protein